MPRRPKATRRPAAGALTPAQYDRLVEQLQHILEKGRRRTEDAVGLELVRTYHALGARLLAQKRAGGVPYRKAVIQRLSDDLDVAPRTLHRAMAFAHAFPDGLPEPALRWAHYRELLSLPAAEQRVWYHAQAIEQGWSARKLREAVRSQLYRDRVDKLLPQPRQQDAQLRRPLATRFGYKAIVERVVDGDTLLVLIDLGFRVHKTERLRLAGIDTPDVSTQRGEQAKQFVERELAAVDCVMLTTDKIDLYGRYVAHVFYAPGATDKDRIFAEGSYLNQRLVDEGLATVL